MITNLKQANKIIRDNPDLLENREIAGNYNILNSVKVSMNDYCASLDALTAKLGKMVKVVEDAGKPVGYIFEGVYVSF